MTSLIPSPAHRLVSDERVDPIWFRWFQVIEDARTAGTLSDSEAAADIALISTALGSPDGTPEKIPPFTPFNASAVTIVGSGPIEVIGSLASGFVSINGRTITDTAVGTLRGITRDAFGRVTGTTNATITGTAGRIGVTNGNAAAGPPTIDLATLADAGVGALLASTRDAWGRLSGTKAATITGTADKITVTNGDAVAGLPTITIAATYAGQASITTLGTIATGVWNGTAVGLAYGGTGQDYSTRSANTVWAGPTSGVPAAPAFRALVAADMPDLSAIYQPLDATLTELAANNWVANAIPIGDAADGMSQVSFAANTFPARASTGNIEAKAITDFGLSLIDDANAAAARTTLGVVIGTDVQGYDGDLAAIAGLADPNADRILFWDDSAGAYKHLQAGSGLVIADTTLTATTVEATQTPTLISVGETFTVYANKQTLFTLPITVDGDLALDGDLVEV